MLAVVNFGGYIQCAINCELVNDSKDDVELTSYTILDENEKILLTKSYDHTVLGANLVIQKVHMLMEHSVN